MFPPGPAAVAHRSANIQPADRSVSFEHIKIGRGTVNRKHSQC